MQRKTVNCIIERFIFTTMAGTLRKFDIEIIHLQNKKYDFSFDIESDFFIAMEQSLIEKGDAHIELELKKSDTMIHADFFIHGRVELVCDRSLRPFYHSIQSKNTIYFKYSDKDEEISEDTVLIKQNRTHIDFSKYIFEFIALEIPIKKIHPDLITDKDNEEGDIMVYSSIPNEDELTDNDIDILDPRWEALKKLKNK